MDELKYRCEDCYGSGERDIKRVIKHEVSELRNIDILEYCYEHYALSDNLSSDIRTVIDRINQYEDVDDILSGVIDRLVSELNALTGKNLRFCLWLGEFQYIQDFYGEPTHASSTSDVILSELGLDGTLYAFENEPTEIEINDLKFYINENS